MRHVIVSRFSVPRLDPASARRHSDRDWLAQRILLFRRYFVPSVERLQVPTVLLCSSQSAELVSQNTEDLPWVSVVLQDSWYGGWTGSPDQMVTRLDSDDALHAGWFRALDNAPADFEVYCTKQFFRLDVQRRSLYLRTRLKPSPLAATKGGRNPYAHDHEELQKHYRAHLIDGAYLLQIVHGGNLSSRRPRWRHFWLRVPLARLAPFGVQP